MNGVKFVTAWQMAFQLGSSSDDTWLLRCRHVLNEKKNLYLF